MGKINAQIFWNRQDVANYLGISRNTLHRYEAFQPLPGMCQGMHACGIREYQIKEWINCLIRNGMILKARIRKEALE